MYKIESCVVTDFSQNCRILIDSSSAECVIIDPGGDLSKIVVAIEKYRAKPIAIWLTHSHLDHCGAVKKLLEQYEIPLYASKIETFMRANVTNIAMMYGITSGFENCPEPSHFISDGDKLEFASNSFQVLFTPGHSPGHLAFYDAKNSILLSGDALFAGSIGRTDLPGGDHQTLISSIRNKFFTLPDNTRVLPGHGPDTTIGEEKRHNPYLKI